MIERENNEKTVCCICELNININSALIPSICKIKNGFSSHKICQECWWNSDTGFGKEQSNHKCPGCEKGLPLKVKNVETIVMIDLTVEVKE